MDIFDEIIIDILENKDPNITNEYVDNVGNIYEDDSGNAYIEG